MFYDKDVDPGYRKSVPSFYGVFPDGVKARTISLLVLTLFTMCHVLSKCLGLALVWLTFGGDVACYYNGADVAVFFLTKIAQRDFFCKTRRLLSALGRHILRRPLS